MLQKHKQYRNTVSVLIAVMTFFGVALHDTKVDSMTKLAIALPAMIASYEGAQLLHMMHGESHTHVERVSVGNMTSTTPKLQARKNEFFHYKVQKNTPKGHQPFDNYSLPIAV